MEKQWDLQPARDLGLSLGQRWQSLHRESGLIETALHLTWWSLVKGYFKAFHRLAIVGGDKIPPAPPFVLVSNHVSHLDALVMGCPLPWRHRDRCFAVAAGDTFFEAPVTAAFAAGVLNALPIWRKKCGPQALKEFRRRLLEEPCAYTLFPEGTRSRDGSLGRFKGGLGMLVAETSVPVIPCHLRGTYESLPPHRRLPMFRPIVLTVGEPLSFATVTNDQAGWKQVAQITEAAVRKLAGEPKTTPR